MTASEGDQVGVATAVVMGCLDRLIIYLASGFGAGCGLFHVTKAFLSALKLILGAVRPSLPLSGHIGAPVGVSEGVGVAVA